MEPNLASILKLIQKQFTEQDVGFLMSGTFKSSDIKNFIQNEGLSKIKYVLSLQY